MEWKAVVQYDSTVSVRQRGKFMKMRLEANDHTITKVNRHTSCLLVCKQRI